MSINEEPVSDAVIRERDGDRCARCGRTDTGNVRLHVHHRLLRAGGSDERACNRVTLCALCHNFVHMHPGISIDEGWIVSRYDDPGQIPVKHVLWPGTLILLTDECAGIKIWLEND